jgi:hypothetical protein
MQMIWGCRRITLEKEELVIEDWLFSSKKRRAYERHRIRAVRQRKDGGDTEDDGYGRVKTNTENSFPTWGLFVETEGEAIIVLRQEPIEQSAWLGPVLAEWCDKPYISSPLQG